MTYDVVITVPEERQPESAGDRIRLLTTAYAKLVDGTKDHRVLCVDYDACVMRLEVTARRFLGVPSGRVQIDITLKPEGGGQ